MGSVPGAFATVAKYRRGGGDPRVVVFVLAGALAAGSVPAKTAQSVLGTLLPGRTELN